MEHVPRVGPLAATTVLAAGALAAAAPLPAASAATQPVPPGLAGQNWTAIPTHAKVVALTFDAGANADGVRSILGTLAQYRVTATFFLTGDFVRAFCNKDFQDGQQKTDFFVALEREVGFIRLIVCDFLC